MVGFLVSINLIFLIGYIFYTGNKKIKYGKLISRKHKRIFNTVLFVIFIVYVSLQTYLIYNVQPTTVSLEQLRENSDVVKTTGDRLGTAVMWLFLSPIFWITLFNFYKEITENFFNKKYISANKNTNYYRGTLQSTSPAIVSFVLENNINVSKAVTADILKLKLEGYIIEEQGSLKCSNIDTSNLSKADQILIDAIKTNNFSENDYIDAVEQETLNMKLLSKHKNKLTKALNIVLNTTPRIIILVMIICAMYVLTVVDNNLIEGVFVFTNDDFSSVDDAYGENGNYYKARYLKVDEDVYNELKEKREAEIEKQVEKELEQEKEKKKESKSEPKTITVNNSIVNLPEFEISSDTQANLRKSNYRMQDLKDQLFFTNLLGDHYIKASYVSVGIVSLDTLITIVQTGLNVLLFLAIVSVTSIIRFIIVSAKYSNKYILTNKGMKFRKEIKGLKKYLKDYSLIKTRTKEEVAIWEYYLIYAIVLHENFEIEDDIIKKFVNHIYTSQV